MVALSTSYLPLLQLSSLWSQEDHAVIGRQPPPTDVGASLEAHFIWDSAALIFHIWGKWEVSLWGFTSTQLMDLLDRVRLVML